jgi:hypothetical protein
MTKGPPARAIRRCARRAAPPTTPPRRSARADPRRAPRSSFLRAPPPRLRASRLRRLVGYVAPADFSEALRLLEAAPTRTRPRGEYKGRCKPESGSSGPCAQRRPRGASARAPRSGSLTSARARAPWPTRRCSRSAALHQGDRGGASRSSLRARAWPRGVVQAELTSAARAAPRRLAPSCAVLRSPRRARRAALAAPHSPRRAAPRRSAPHTSRC